MRLSKKQKQVISKLKDGYWLMKNITYTYIPLSGVSISVATFFFLSKNRLIKRVGKPNQFSSQQYQLTELGKTIKL